VSGHKREVKELLAYAESRGCEAVIGASGHWKIYLGPHLVTTIGSTPSSPRSMKNSRTFLDRRLRELETS
jgi:hypothetical protein